jgi:hypothetical protein
MSGLKMITAARLRDVHAGGPDVTVIRADVTDGPEVAKGRSVQVFLDDNEVRTIMTRLALDPRWAPAFIALAHHPHVSNAAMGARSLNAHGTQQQALAAVMETAAGHGTGQET